jgi:YVTN family beta-propeller protein
MAQSFRRAGRRATFVLGLVASAATLVAVPASAAPPTYGVLDPIPVDAYPFLIAVDANTHTAYATDYSQATVSAIDTSTNTLVATIPVGQGAQGVAIDSAAGRVYVTNFESNTVSVIDEATNAVVDTIAVGTAPAGVAVDPARHTAYVTNEGDDSLSVVDTNSDTVVDTIPVGRIPRQIAVDTDLDRAYVVTFGDHDLTEIDLATNTVTATIGVGTHPIDVAIDPTTHTVYTTVTTKGGQVVAVDESTDAVVAKIPVAGADYLALDPADNTGYVTDFQPAEATVLDLAAKSVVTTVATPGNEEGAAVDPTTHTAYLCRNQAVDQFGILGAARVTRVHPTSGPAFGHERIKVFGTGFSGAQQVLFGNVPAVRFHVRSDSLIVAITPGHAPGTVDVRVDMSPVSPGDKYEFIGS